MKTVFKLTKAVYHRSEKREAGSTARAWGACAVSRKQFKMAPEQMKSILAPALLAGGLPPLPSQEYVNLAWQELARELGFVWDTARPVSGEGMDVSRRRRVMASERAGTEWISEERTPWGVYCREDFDVGKPFCNDGEIIYLTGAAYDAQMNMPDARWKCPICGGSAQWSDDNFESWYMEHPVPQEVTDASTD